PMDRRISPRSALILLLVINLFNYVDRQVLSAVVPLIKSDLHATDRQMGWTPTAFLLSYMILSPVFGILGDRMSRWILVAIGVGLWSLASGATGLAATFGALILTRCCVGVGEAAYGPIAPTLLSDLYSVNRRGQVLSWFYMAIPVGSALGYVLGGVMATHWGWRSAFYAVVAPGLLLAVISMLMPEPPRGAADRVTNRRAKLDDYLLLFKTPSFVLDTLGMTAMTFATAGIAFWMPTYIDGLKTAGDLEKINLYFGGIAAASGFLGTLAGGWAGDKLRGRLPGSYFLVSAAGMAVGFPIFLVMLYTPFPLAWVLIFLTCFCLFFNTGPTSAILANVTHPQVRATAFAVNIFIVHLLGDAISPEIIGRFNNLRSGFIFVSGMMLLGAFLWFWGARFLARDVAAIENLAETRSA
ncbi:MAG TPA: MFS transporter, partial [Tepidisphaeraceae bacterium]|nr:MFS transporter [Tepidisphaeraceae bacterium]